MTLGKYTLFLALALILLPGCASEPSGPLYLRPLGQKAGAYEPKDNGWVFSKKSVSVSVRQVTEKDIEAPDAITGWLLGTGHILIRMDIENSSKDKAIYNPALTALVDNEVNYHKPLDYTDFYELSVSNEEVGRSLSGVRASFYDLTVTLQPGEKTSRLLAFKGFPKTAKTANLSIKELYIGTDTVNIAFAFQFRP